MQTSTLLPCIEGIAIESIASTYHSIVLRLSTVDPYATCPLCGVQSGRIHSRYERTLADLPWNQVAVRIHLRSRKLFCDNPTCERRVFTEPLPELAARYARKTNRLQEAFYIIGYALGGKAGARVAVGLGLATSPDTLLRQVRQATTEQTAPSRLRVVGVDDWAYRRGQRYGTLLVDLERHCVVDLLPDRSSESLAAWLKKRPDIGFVSRDRAEVYAEGARQGAPDAQQIADRWHLLKNVGDAVEKALLRQHRYLKEAAQRMAVSKTGERAAPQSAVEPLAPSVPTRAEREKALRREKRLALYEQVQAQYREGYNLSALVRRTGLSPKTIRKYVQAETCPYYPDTRKAASTVITPFSYYLKQRWEAGCHNAAQLMREIKAQGYAGQYSVLCEYLRSWRAQLSPEERQSTTGRKGQVRGREETPSPRSVRWWLLGHRSKSDPQQRDFEEQFVQTLQDICPEVQTLQTLAQEFARLLKGKNATELESWLEKADTCGIAELQSVAKSLRQDKAAVEAAISQKWSNGQVEGQVNRLKMLKRQMYGRARFDLLRARVLPMAQAA